MSLPDTANVSSSYPEGNFGGNQLLDGSISLSPPIPRFDERFARQYRYEPPSGFPLTSPCSGIVHHLSGPNGYALTQIDGKPRPVDGARRVNCDPISGNALAALYFHCALGFVTQILAYTLDSLVRVSRRVEANHLIRIANMRVVYPGGSLASAQHSFALLHTGFNWPSYPVAHYRLYPQSKP